MGTPHEIDTPAFREFKAKRQLWIAMLSGEDRNSIFNQIHEMIWDAAAFRVINEARRIAPKDSSGNVELNGMVHDLINRGFFVIQASTIRRLVDRETRTGKQEVYSLWRLLDCLEKDSHLLTREHLFAAEGILLDYENGQQRGVDPRDLDRLRLEERHEQIDRLAGVHEKQRTPGDAVKKDWFCRLKCVLDTCSDFQTYVNKFIAHAASPGSRAAVNADQLTITLGHLWPAHEAICKAANFLDVYIVSGTSHFFLAAPQYDHLEYIDRPLVKPGCTQAPANAWETYGQETQEWGNWGLDELEAWQPRTP